MTKVKKTISETDIYKINRSKAEDLSIAYWQSPVGWLEIQCTAAGLRAVNFVDAVGESKATNAHIELTINQLQEYFDGKRQAFDIPFDMEGTDFQLRVWAQLLKIPFGKTCSYMDMAKALGDPKVIRAVGLANGSNKIAIIVPCHRVIGADGSLVGYASGLFRKKWLLDFENPPVQMALF